MFEAIIIGISIILIIWASIFSWKLDNGASTYQGNKEKEGEGEVQ